MSVPATAVYNGGIACTPDGAVYVQHTSNGTIDSPTFTGVASFANGSAAAPSIAFTNSPTTGFYRAGTDILGIATAGTARWQVDASGNWLAATDGQGQIGQVGGNRPANIFTTGLCRFMNSTATPAGGAAAGLISLGSASVGIYWGSGVPTVSAAQGSIYLRTDGSSTSTRLYVNTSGSTTWTNFTSAA